MLGAEPGELGADSEWGNAEYHDLSGTYDARFAQFYNAIKQAHPELQVVATAPVTLVRGITRREVRARKWG
jgi:hypothetical protein